MGEQKALRQEANWLLDGAPPRDLRELSRWRAVAMPENVALLDMYGELLVNQYAGFTDALNLEAARAAMDICMIPREEWRDTARRLIIIHTRVVATIPKKKAS